MTQVNVYEAKTHLSRLLDAVESGAEREVIIARNGKPVAKLVPAQARPLRFGAAKGEFEIPDPDPELDAEVERLFLGDDA
ncbi:MAG TPA: type II toxin-antitoxin system prevent-host-death family antitoxin [Caulobacteraceae bacterium]|nr:type II toxin-antitoxin system prevent-host-death family antitoxin [Caulobacteraceae bacterium]